MTISAAGGGPLGLGTSADPLTVGRFTGDETRQIARALFAGAGQFANDFEALARCGSR